MGARHLKKLFENRLASIALTGAAVAIMFFGVYYLFIRTGMGDVQNATDGRMFIDASTGKTFRHNMELGETVPVVSPSGDKSGYPAEACYWAADGSAKSEPTWVLLNSVRGLKEQTFCPDCGRLVVAHNPAPGETSKAPPTKAEVQKRASKPSGGEN